MKRHTTDQQRKCTCDKPTTEAWRQVPRRLLGLRRQAGTVRRVWVCCLRCGSYWPTEPGTQASQSLRIAPVEWFRWSCGLTMRRPDDELAAVNWLLGERANVPSLTGPLVEHEPVPDGKCRAAGER